MPEAATTQATALLALWNDVDPAEAHAYEAWHSQEHVPERCTVPGILWGRRYGSSAPSGIAPMPQFLTLYGLRHAQVLSSDPYQHLLREPTPMSRRMRPVLRNVSRWVCRLHEDSTTAPVERLLVWTVTAAIATAPTIPGHSHLVAERIADPAPLPWLSEGQDRGIEGRWLCAMAVDSVDEGAAPPSSVVYTRLPIGAAAA